MSNPCPCGGGTATQFLPLDGRTGGDDRWAWHRLACVACHRAWWDALQTRPAREFDDVMFAWATMTTARAWDTDVCPCACGLADASVYLASRGEEYPVCRACANAYTRAYDAVPHDDVDGRAEDEAWLAMEGQRGWPRRHGAPQQDDTHPVEPAWLRETP